MKHHLKINIVLVWHLLLFVLGQEAIAVEQNKVYLKVLIRNKNSYKTSFQSKEMKNLLDENSFNGRYFKIVKKKNEHAISFDDIDSELVSRAATVYYHLNKSRDFWIHQIGSTFASEHPPITVRLDISNKFSDLAHFANDSLDPQFNNALSIPSGKTPDWVPEDRQKEWGKEIWFRPMKKIPMISPGVNPITTALQSVEKPLINFSTNQMTFNLMDNLFNKTMTFKSISKELLNLGGTYALIRFIIFSSKKADKLFLDRFYYLDSAFVPEIIYHEYAHIILSEHLELSHSTPVNEGMADYFAAIQSGLKRVYEPVPGRSNASSKDTRSRKFYDHWDESNRAATSDFTLSVLWDVREVLTQKISDQLIYEARKYLETSTATIQSHLLSSLLQSCEKTCEAPFKDKLKMYEVFSAKGF